MTWNDVQPRLEPQTSLKNIPLPLLLPGLSLLTAPVQMLQDELVRQLGQNVLATVTPPCRLNSAPPGERESWLENIPATMTLEDHLTPQLFLAPSMKDLPSRVTTLLLEGLDPRGYLRAETSPLLREVTGLGPEDVESVILDIQDWVDPPGLFARDLVECLLIQLRRDLREGHDPWIVLRRGSDYLVRGDLPGLARYLEWSEERLQHALEDIRHLDPRPGSSFSNSAPIIPEIAFEKSSDGISVRLLHENLPRLTLENDLLAYIDQPPFNQQWATARRVMSALAMRLRTKLKCARILARLQEPFLTQAEAAPSPVILDDLARLMDCHPSTVQRALATTWACSPRGTVLLANLLSRPVRACPTLSVAQLRHAIAKYRSLGESDRNIAERVGVPRRTVAWHRKRMGL